jgi:hypothetical protein
MSSDATAIRDMAFLMFERSPGYKTIRKTTVRQLQPDDLPALTFFIASEQMVPDGDANVGEPRFESTITIGISVTRGFSDPVELDGLVDVDVDLIEATLLTSTTFLSLFEACTGITRQRLYPQQGETYFAELRLQMSFLTRVHFDPVAPNDFLDAVVRTRPLGTNPENDDIYNEYRANPS